MVPTLSKVFDDLFAVSRGDVATLDRATREFVRDITQENRIPLHPSAPAEGAAAPTASTVTPPPREDAA